MVEIIFTFIITFLVLSMSWFIPKAGTGSFNGPTGKEFAIIAGIAVLPALALAIA